MKKLGKKFYCSIVLLLLILALSGCTGTAKKESEDRLLEDSLDFKQEENAKTEESSKTEDSNEAILEETENGASNQPPEREEDDSLSKYSSEEIEYARVWLQLGPNQEIDALYVRHIPAGTPLNPDDNINVSYPEDVIQLSGSRLVDGSVTYSGNGDGSINVYNVPLRWYGGFPPPEDIDKDKVREDMEGIVRNTTLVSIDPAKGENVIRLIHIIKNSL